MEFDDRKEYTEHNYGNGVSIGYTQQIARRRSGSYLEEIAEQLGYIDMNVKVVPK